MKGSLLAVAVLAGFALQARSAPAYAAAVFGGPGGTNNPIGETQSQTIDAPITDVEADRVYQAAPEPDSLTASLQFHKGDNGSAELFGPAPSPVPEPGALLIVATGLVGLTFARKRLPPRR